MQLDLLSFRLKNDYVIGANLGLRVIVLQPDSGSVACDVDLQANADDHFSLSQDGRLLAAALSSEAFSCVEVFDLSRNAVIVPESRENSMLLRIDRTHALDVRLAPDNETLFYWKHGTAQGTYAFHLPSGDRKKIPKATFPSKGAWLNASVVLPFCRGRGGVRVSYWPPAASVVELPSKHSVWQLIERPDNRAVALLDAHGQVMGLDADTLEPHWRCRVPEAGWISYTGDGRFIAVQQHAPRGGRVERIVILEASLGTIVRTLAVERSEMQAYYPLSGPRCLCYRGLFLNAETGEYEEGVSALDLWRSLLRRQG